MKDDQRNYIVVGAFVLAMVAALRAKAQVQLFQADGTPLVVPNVIRSTQ